MGDKIDTIIRSLGEHNLAERLAAAGLAEVSDPEDTRAGQVGQIFAETLGLTVGPEEHVVLGRAVLHARRALTRAPAVEEG